MHTVVPLQTEVSRSTGEASDPATEHSESQGPRPKNRISLRTALLVELGFVTSSAVAIVGLTTILITGSDLRDILGSLSILWLGSTAVFVLFGGYVVHRLVVVPLRRLTIEADALAVGQFPTHTPQETAELELLATRYRAMAENLLDAQSQMVRVEKLASIGRLAAGVAHEVRNPLGALGSYVQVLDRRGIDPTVVGDMQQAVERIERIVQGLVDYARPGRSPARPDEPPRTTDLNLAVRNALDFLGAQELLRQQRLELSLEPGLPLVSGDQHLLEQVVVNLVINACQASPQGRLVIGTLVAAIGSGRRDVTQRRDEKAQHPDPVRTWAPQPRPHDIAPGTRGVMLYVADDGPGVPEADRERVFDPFFTTKDPGQGTGLGLAIVARTVHESGGTVWVDRAREGGAVFKVFLPIAGETNAAADR